MTQSEPMTIREATEAGMFPTLAAARKAVHRARLIPVGYHYAAALYEVAALATCQPRKVIPMTDSDTRVETWKAIPGYPNYEASDQGHIRSIPRTEHGRTYQSVVLSTRISNRGYVLVDVRDGGGRKQTRTVHTLVLEAFVGPCPRGMEARHLHDIPTDNRLSELKWGTKAENVEDTFRNGRQRAAPRPPKTCIRCSAEFEGSGKRCHPCVVEIGEEAARLLAAGVTLEEVSRRLDYPHQSGLHTLARVHGGYGLPPSPSVTHRASVLATLRSWRRGQR